MDLIKVTTNNQGEQLVSARELHQFLEVGKDFTTWIKGRIEKYGFIENVDFTVISSFPQNGGKGGRPKEEYIIKIDMAKELAMVENNDKGRQARRYFIECEKKLKQVTQPKLPQTYLEALKELVKVEEEKLSLENKVKNLTHQSKLYTATEIAKELGFKSASEFNKILEADKIQYKVNGTWVLTAKYADKNYTSIKQFELDNGTIRYDRRWNGLGRQFLIEKYGQK